MKLQKVFLVLIILFASFQICLGQEKLKAEQINEFGILDCDDFLSRLDNFFNVLKNEPSSTGYVIIYTEKGSRQLKRYETWINGQVYFAKFDSNRLVIKHTKKEDGFRVVFWRVPAEASLPAFVEQKTSFVLPSSTKAFMLATSVYDICPTLSPKLYADYLQANPNMRGHIVVSNKSIKEAKKDGENWLKVLTKEFNVSRNQLKVFYNKNHPYSESETEFWLVPQKKK